jgi:hypothetical protein
LTDHKTTIDFLKKLRLVLTVLNVDDSTVSKALESEFGDFEDAVQYFTAVHNEINYIITRNTDDYKKSAIPVYTPTEFLKMMEMRQENSIT